MTRASKAALWQIMTQTCVICVKKKKNHRKSSGGGDLSVRRLSRGGRGVAERNSKHGSKTCYLGTAWCDCKSPGSLKIRPQMRKYLFFHLALFILGLVHDLRGVICPQKGQGCEGSFSQTFSRRNCILFLLWGTFTRLLSVTVRP